MKTNIKYMALLIGGMLTISGCTSDTSQPTEKETGTTSPIAIEQERIQPEAPVVEPTALEAFLQKEPSAPAMGRYLRENRRDLTSEEMTSLLEDLVLAQTAYAQTMNELIFQLDYLKALNVDMGGILDPQKLDQIEDPLIRRNYADLVDSFMTIVRYEEVPIVEPDYQALLDLDLPGSGHQDLWLTTMAKIQSGHYFTNFLPDYDQLGADGQEIETALLASTDPFMKWQLKQTHIQQIGLTFVGGEGSHLSNFSEGMDHFVDGFETLANNYPGTLMGQIAQSLLDSDNKDFFNLINIVNTHGFYPGETSLNLVMTQVEDRGAEIHLVQVEGHGDPDIQVLINQTILDHLAQMTLDNNKSQVLRTGVNFSNANYLSLYLSNTYSDTTKGIESIHRNLTLDLRTGQVVTLETLFNRPFEDYREDLTRVLEDCGYQASLSQQPSFFFSQLGLVLVIEEDQADYPVYLTLPLGKLTGLMDVRQLY